MQPSLELLRADTFLMTQDAGSTAVWEVDLLQRSGSKADGLRPQRRHLFQPSKRELSFHESLCATCCSLHCPRLQSKLVQLSPLLQMQDSRSKDGIADSKVQEAIKRNQEACSTECTVCQHLAQSSQRGRAAMRTGTHGYAAPLPYLGARAG